MKVIVEFTCREEVDIADFYDIVDDLNENDERVNPLSKKYDSNMYSDLNDAVEQAVSRIFEEYGTETVDHVDRVISAKTGNVVYD